MEISYRKLAAAEARQYREIRLESLKLHPASFGASFEEQSRLPRLRFEAALEQPADDQFMIGAFDQQELIGICGFLPFVVDNDPRLRNTGTIIQVYVKPAYRGKGIGLELVNAVLREGFKLAGIEQIVLGVTKGNTSAIRVYEQAGFQPYHAEGRGTGRNEGDLRMIIRKGQQ